MASNQEPPRVVPPRELSFWRDRLLSVVRLNLLLGGNRPPVPLLKGKETCPLGDPVALQQVIDLLKILGIDESIVNKVQDRIQAKTKAAKTNSELVAELERKREKSQAQCGGTPAGLGQESL